MSIRFDDRVVIVTGGGNGLGRSHCLKFAENGAKVVVNDLGGNVDGTGSSQSAAERVVEEIRAAGGQAIANGANVVDMDQVEAMVEETMSEWGRVDVLVNNAGILRDKTFHKMDMSDFKTVLDVHLIGSANCTRAVWEIMRAQEYGRIVMTSSSSGLFGNFGQSNYGAAKMGMIGLMNVLTLEGQRYNIRVNALAPTATTRMTEGLGGGAFLAEVLQPELVSPAVLFLTAEDAPSRTILGAGAGAYAVTHVCETKGHFISDKSVSPDDIAANWAAICDRDGEIEQFSASEQTMKFVDFAAKERGIEIA